MGVFMVVRAGAALVSRISQMLVSYRWAPTMVPSSYLVQVTDAGSVPCSATIYTRARTVSGPFFLGFPGGKCADVLGGAISRDAQNRPLSRPEPSLFSVWSAGRRRKGSCKINNLRAAVHCQPRPPVQLDDVRHL